MSARSLTSRVAELLCVISAMLALSSASAAAAGAPVVERSFVSAAGVSQADLDAVIIPGESETSYHFEYGPTAAYGASTQVASIPAGETGKSVTVHITGLTPGSSYHFRVLAGNAEGSTEGGDETFQTFAEPSPAVLPDNRAYELVSPVQKNGADILSESWNTRASTDGDAVQYASLAAFGDAKGILYQAQYLARRTPTGWESHSLVPPQRDSNGLLPSHEQGATYLDEFSPDLSKGLLHTFPAVTDAPNVAAVPNLYVNEDQLTPGAEDYRLVSDCPACTSPLPSSTYDVELVHPYTVIESIPVGASADFRHVAFESTANLTVGAAGVQPKLYEWEEGTVRLVGQVPSSGSQCGPGGPACAPAESSTGGSGVGVHLVNAENESGTYAGTSYTHNMVSRDGSHVFFTTPPYKLASNAGASFRPTGNIFMRVDHSVTVQINADQPLAQLWTATPDGGKAFYTTEDGELYAFEADKPSGQQRTLLANNVAEVLGTSEDGSYVYFTSDSELVPGQPRPGTSQAAGAMYLWHNGTVSFIGVNNGQDGWFSSVRSFSQVHGGSVVRVTPSGVLLYATRTPQTLYDTESSDCSEEGRCVEIYIYDPAVGKVKCASCDPTGAAPTGDAEFIAQHGAVAFYFNQHLNHPVTEDGSEVFFSTPDALVPQDTNGREDVYEYNVQQEKVALISTGQCDCDSYFVEASPDGHDVFFTTSQSLVRIDTDNLRDLYDARVDGGIAAQNALPPAECQADACQAPAPTLVDSTPASLTYSGAGNPTARPPTVKAKKKVRAPRKQRRHKKRAHKRRAHAKPHTSRARKNNHGGAR
jgi:hypothetical protein